MRHSHRALINTGSLYIKIGVSAAVTLISTRIALQALGVDSYGLYNLIAGVISLLAFFNGALMVSAQRFLSIALGEKDEFKMLNVFKISFFVHLILATVVGGGLKIIQPFLFDSFLNISPDMIDVGKSIFDIMILSSIVTILGIPYNAAINAREEMWFFSISEIVVGLLKLGAALYLLFAKDDLLFIYTLLMFISITLGAVIKYIWCYSRYPECRINIQGGVNRILFLEMFSFASWNTLGSLTMVVRNQGIAVILNIFFGTVLNAAYGVANQLNALVITFAGTLTTVFTPMIIKARGEGDNEKMLFISVFSSKMSFLLSSIIALPVLLYTPFILNLWLGEVPQNTVEFCQLIIVSFLIMQLYPGITRALYAEGNIKWYQIIISFLLISIIPIGYILFMFGFSPISIFIVLVIAQILTLIATVYFAGKKVNLNIEKFYYTSVLFPTILFISLMVLGHNAKVLVSIGNYYIEFFIISFFITILYLILYYKAIFNSEESKLLKLVLISLKVKLNKSPKKS